MIVSMLLWSQEQAEDHKGGFAEVEDNQGTEKGYRVKLTTQLL